MPAWIHTHCPNCNMPYPSAASECGACGRTRDPLIVPPPVVEAARPETYQNAVLPSAFKVTSSAGLIILGAILASVLKATVSEGLIILFAILIALTVIYLRLHFHI